MPGERQRRLDAADATLPAHLKERYRIDTREKVAELYPNEWVAFWPTHVDAGSQLTAGRLFEHARDKDELERALEPLRRAYPDLWLYVYFTGRYDYDRPEGSTIIVRV